MKGNRVIKAAEVMASGGYSLLDTPSSEYEERWQHWTRAGGAYDGPWTPAEFPGGFAPRFLDPFFDDGYTLMTLNKGDRKVEIRRGGRG